MTDWRDLYRRVWRVDNVPVMIALVVGVIALVTPAFGDVTVGRALQLIMIVLVGIVLSLGLDRISRLVDIFQELKGIAAAVERMEHPTADTVLKARRATTSPLFDSGDAAKELFAMGITAKNFAEAAGFLDRLLRQGTDLRILVWKFDERMAAATAPSLDGSVDILRANRDAAMASCRELAKRRQQNAYAGSIEVREHPSVPRVTMLVADPDEPWGTMHVEMLPYAVPAEDRPTFRLTRAGSAGGWYELFLEAAENAWRSAEQVDLLAE